MFGILKAIYCFLSPYVNLFERKVDKFFQNVKSTDNIFSIQKTLLELMQKDLVTVNVWLEKKFKGYTYLTKGVRRKMYRDTQAIVLKFQEFCEKFSVDEGNLKMELDGKGLLYPSGNFEQLKHLACICAFLRPGTYYEYIKTSSFGKLLRDPNKEKLQGDCNQIVTLYIYLYSLKFPLNDLQIKLLPEHVCLHFRGVDVEATAGGFTKYAEFEHLLPVTEIISTNLLDLNDFRESTQRIDERAMLKSAQLAYAISSLKELVEQNLEVAYHNLGVSSMNNNDFKAAVFYLSRTKKRELLETAYNNACAYYAGKKDFDKAKYYASESGNTELRKKIENAQYSNRYNELAKKVAVVKTMEDAKKFKSCYSEMLDLARKLNDSRLESQVAEILRQI
ncbi:MAG: hypothetical protein WCX95_03205 [Candidatus Gracilibacteria bacterium]